MDTITLNVIDLKTNNRVLFKIKSDTKFERLINSIEERQGYRLAKIQSPKLINDIDIFNTMGDLAYQDDDTIYYELDYDRPVRNPI